MRPSSRVFHGERVGRQNKPRRAARLPPLSVLVGTQRHSAISSSERTSTAKWGSRHQDLELPLAVLAKSKGVLCSPQRP